MLIPKIMFVSSAGAASPTRRRENLNIDGMASGSSREGMVKERLSMQPYKVSGQRSPNSMSRHQSHIGPYLDNDMLKERTSGAPAAELIAESPKVKAIRAATMLKQAPRDQSSQEMQRSFQVGQHRKASLDQPRYDAQGSSVKGLTLN